METILKTTWLGRELTFKTGKLAKQADASLLVQYGETVVMASVVQAKNAREGIDYFPLMVDFEEKLYAAGIIKGSRWIKREGRPSDQAVLLGRMVDRAIRPLFDQTDRRDVQLILTLLSLDQENDYDVVALIAGAAALRLSNIKWQGPIAGLRVGLIDNDFVFNPSFDQQEKSELDLIIAGDTNKVIMIEAGANDIAEDKIAQAIFAGQKQLKPVLKLMDELKEKAGKTLKEEKEILESNDEKKEKEEKEKLLEIAKKWLENNVKSILFDKELQSKGERKIAVSVIKENLDKYLFSLEIKKDLRSYIIKQLVENYIDQEVTKAILEEKRRVDGRSLNDIRELSSEVDIINRTHGSALFSRGETQMMTIVTLGAPGLEQSLEGVEGQSKKRFMHHYNFPPFSVGEVSMLRGTGRREIGHGALAEKALMPVVPDKESFPYTIRIVSETLGSNGSSSMAATCASSLALMDAGVPIKKIVGGIAMGIASNNDMSKWEVLSDIQDLEDGQGGADFKITGTNSGLTAIQLDTKTLGLKPETIEKIFKQGREALNKVIANMQATIAQPRAELSPYAPKIISLNVDPEKIGAIIGPGGKVINKIIEETGVSIDIDDDGLVMICGTDQEMAQKALAQIKEIVHVFEAGEIISGKVVRMLDFGVFVELNANQDGMVHVSEIAPYRISKPSDVLKVGDIVSVKIKEIDDQGRINLSMKGLEENKAYWENEKGKSTNNFSGNNNRRPKPRY
jgi:polyribonucleotide nucleotidyltransferase